MYITHVILLIFLILLLTERQNVVSSAYEKSTGFIKKVLQVSWPFKETLI